MQRDQFAKIRMVFILFNSISFFFIPFFSLPPSQGLLFTVHQSGRLRLGIGFMSVGLGVNSVLKRRGGETL